MGKPRKLTPLPSPLRQFRLRLGGISQAAAGRLVGISQSEWGRIENGAAIPRPGLAKKISKLTGLAMVDVLGTYFHRAS